LLLRIEWRNSPVHALEIVVAAFTFGLLAAGCNFPLAGVN
jgi:hypothetical protein